VRNRRFLATPRQECPAPQPSHGIPISLKDNIYSARHSHHRGSRFCTTSFLARRPVVTALKKAGAIILGKTNMHEFAYGTTSNNPHYGPVAQILG